MKYRKKPVVIDAWFFKDQWSEKPDWLIEARDHDIWFVLADDHISDEGTTQ